LRLSREPSLTATAASTTDELAARAARVLARIEWPGKPGATPIIPLTPEEQARFDAGREIYANVCAACHQTDGRGRADLAPALIGSTFALGPGDLAARILIGGKEGTVGLMPPLGATFTDEQVASVLTYIRREWGQAASPVTPALVKPARDASAGRTRPWTNDELIKLGASLGAGGAQ
jgi:mono/diheme cytochrome c family protein